MRSRPAGALAFATLFLTAAAVQAAKPQAWTFAAQKDFAQGRFDNVVVDSYGELTLGRTLTPVPTDPAAESVQAFAQTPDGAIYVATSPAATVYRIQDGKSSVVYKAEKGFDDITAMTADAKGNLLVALSGASAKLISITPGEKTAVTTLFQKKAVAYIWAVVEAADGTLYLGTGPHGKVYKLPPKGDPAAFLETGQKNVTALAFDHDHNLIAGTDAHGLVIRANVATGKPFVLLDAGKVDVNAITADAAGNLYVATARAEMNDQNTNAANANDDNSDTDEPDTKSKPDAPELEPVDPPQDNGGGAMSPQGKGPDFAGINTILGVSPPDLPADLKALLKQAAAQKSAALANDTKHKSNDLGARPGKMRNKALRLNPPEEPEDVSTVYRIAPDGVVATLLQQEGLNYSLLLAAGPAGEGDELLIGTGDEGKLYAYHLKDQSTALVARIKEQQISTLFADKAGNIFLGAGNMAQVYQMGAALSTTGSFTSQVLDASHTADWGHAILTSTRPDGTRITIATRSGNTQNVDANPKFWSDWSDADAHAKITSPAARYLQLRITLSAEGQSTTPTLDTLRVAYQTHNLPPHIKNVSLQLPGITPPSDDDADADTGAGPDDPSATPPEKVAHISWDATDPNNDTLLFRLYYKPLTPDGQNLWTPLARNVKDATYAWDTRSIPDGKYQVKVVASDSPDNPAPDALESARTSAPFTLNHTPPALSDLHAFVEGNKATVTGTAKDALSPVTDVRYQVDGQIYGEDWQPAAASDKIFDSPQEPFTLVTRPLSAGPHRITVRATDSAGNNSYQALTITVKP